MPTYIRPARVDITGGGRGIGGLVLIAAGLAAAAAVAMFVLAHLALLAGCAAAFLAIMGAVIAAMRWVASPKRLRRQLHPQYPARVAAPRPAQAIPAPQPRAIEAPGRSRAADPAIARIRSAEEAEKP